MPLRVRKNLTPPPPPVCPLMECMKLVGGAWTPNILWYLSAGPRRFGELRVDIEGISAKVLTARLRDLEQKAVVARRVLPTSPPSVEYSLTPLGRELLPVIRAIVAVGEKLKRAPATPARASKPRRSGQARTSRTARGEDGAR